MYKQAFEEVGAMVRAQANRVLLVAVAAGLALLPVNAAFAGPRAGAALDHVVLTTHDLALAYSVRIPGCKKKQKSTKRHPC